MSSERTEAATPRRRQEARQKGQIAKSVEINSAAILLAAFWLISVTGPRFIESLRMLMQHSFSALSTPEITFNTLHTASLTIGGIMVQTVGPLVLTLMVVGVAANLVQVGFLFSPQALQPDPGHINPLNGFRRIFSERGLVELVKSLLKLAVISAVVYMGLRDNYSTVVAASRMALSSGIGILFQLGVTVGLRTAVAMLVIAIADYLFQRWQFEKNLRMTKQEVKEEMKRYENPQLKARIRSRQRQLAMSRMMAAVPEADVVITNPIHLAIALRYESGKSHAPRIVAKGQRLVAERIKEKARQHRVPMVENKPLAQALFKSVEIGQEVPADLYQAVAEVLAFVYRLKSTPKTIAY